MAHTIAIFGASGDLTGRKLIPALFELFRKKRLPENTRIVGFSRTKYSHEAWREKLAGTTAHFVGKTFSDDLWRQFAASIFYHPGDLDAGDDLAALANELAALEGDQPATRVYYLATAPHLYAPALARLGAAGLANEDRAPSRVVIEKPFGADLAAAQATHSLPTPAQTPHRQPPPPEKKSVSAPWGIERILMSANSRPESPTPSSPAPHPGTGIIHGSRYA